MPRCTVLLLLACGCAGDEGGDSGIQGTTNDEAETATTPSTGAPRPNTSTADPTPGSTSTPDPTTTTTTTSSTGPDTANPDTSADTGPSPTVVDDEWIARLEGRWVGEMRDGPFGDYDDFEMTFGWNGEGDMEANIVLSSKSTMDFRFEKVDGVWELREGVAVPNGGSHSNKRMTQLERDGDRVRWVWDDEAPEDAWVDITVTADTQLWDVQTRSCGHAPGERHAIIEVTRG